MKGIIKILAIASFVLLNISMLSAKQITINYENDWAPYTYQKGGQAKGVLVEIMKEALKGTGITAKFVSVPWKRALQNTKRGSTDALLGASYKDKRAAFAYYPRDAKRAKFSKWRMEQVEYVVVTLKNNRYNFTGNWKTIPQPVRAPFGYSIVGNIEKKMGIKVDTARTDRQNLSKMLRDKTGSIVTNPIIANSLNRWGKGKGKLHISRKPLKSKSYHLIFSKKGKLTAGERQKIWNKIKKIRTNRRLMLKLYRRK